MSRIPSQRELFEVPEDVAYFSCAYNSPQLRESSKRLIAGVRSKAEPWSRTAAGFFDDVETVRSLASTLFGGGADGYAVIPAASYGVSTAARAIEPRLETGDRILLLAEEFPSNVLPWQRTARETGARIETVATPADGDWTRAILERIESGVKVVALSTCHWTNGARIDLAPIGEACREIASALAIDATQSLGAMRFSVEEIQPDFLVAAGYKWLLAPYGFGILFVSERFRDARPLEESWLVRTNAEDFASLVNYSETYRKGARKFDVGETSTPTILPGAIAALEQIASWGIENIAETLSAINSNIATRLETLGFQLPGERQRSPHMFGAQAPAGRAEAVVSELRKRNIHVSRRGSSIRFAPHLHVDDHDVERLLRTVAEVV